MYDAWIDGCLQRSNRERGQECRGRSSVELESWWRQESGASSQAFEQEKTKPERTQEAEINTAHAAAATEVMMPECMEKLKLTEEQQTRAREVIGSYDQKLDAVWKQFSVKYMATIRTECLLLAAVEDGFSEPQLNCCSRTAA